MQNTAFWLVKKPQLTRLKQVCFNVNFGRMSAGCCEKTCVCAFIMCCVFMVTLTK